MNNIKMCLGINSQFGCSPKEQIDIFKKTGFEAFFIDWNRDTDIKELKQYADMHEMIFQSIHAPFAKAADLWKNDKDSEAALNELLECLKDCAENDVPIMVCHAILGFDKHSPNRYGVENYRRVVEKAKEYGVKIAFENTEGEEYLEELMSAFADYENVGFCWDTGHEMCYNRGKDMMELYGNRILCTHLNDNLGIKAYDGTITWTDDLHLLPFDGIADWDGIVKRLNKYNYNDILTFELCKLNRPERHESDGYEKMSIGEYVAEVYKRACRVAMLKQRG